MRFNINLGVNLPAWRSWLFRHAAELIRDRELSAGQSADRRNASTPSLAHEYLWRYSSPMEEFGTRWVPHRIVRAGTKEIQVEASPSLELGREDRTRRPAGTYSVDRHELRRYGLARAESSRTVFFSQPRASDRVVRAVNAVQRLGLWFPFSEDDLRQAYLQRARAVHPDAGGSSNRFVQLQEDYRRARELLDLGWTQL